ncbi:MAG: type II toxin-antitoxin system PemK/MazF family toxin [Terriglobia bacterium]
MSISGPLRAEVWDLSFDPTVGHEQAGARPALIASVDLFNEGPAELVVAIPITGTERKVRWHVQVAPPEGGLIGRSFIQCENVRSVSKKRLRRRRGRVSEETMQQVEDRLRILLGL